ncbi:MAG TPA: hypothetical protein VJR94_08505 [Candidatus Nitrosocosmicus sp.]|nr:hypothetical protein [Candidatus Nitrosocosmicus sp.]
MTSNDSSTSRDRDKNYDKIRWAIEVIDLYKLHHGESRYEDRFSIVRKSYKDESLIESQNIIVNRKNLFQIKDKIDSVLNECM